MFQTIKTGEGSMSGIYEIGQYGTAVSGFMPIHNSSDSIVGVVGVDILIEDVFSPSRVFTFISDLLITLILCSIVPISLQIFLFRRMIGRPIKELSSACTKIGSGELDVPLSIDTGDEIEDLAHTLTKMTTQLKEYIANLTKITAEKERIEVELNIATQIQASMLPCVFPAFPDRDEFDIYAMMQPAKEVGGDFYDFFQVDENTLAVVMADVSGKGIPGALFMVISKTLIKNNALDGKSPKEVFETVNNMLCENNGAGMFVTAFLGYIDIPSGKFTFVNAGHNPPLLRNGERFDWMKTKRGFVLAGKENMHYKEVEMVLQPGDELFLYTDGVTEATNNENELFSETRLCETVNEYHDLPLKEIAMSLMHEIDTFVEGAEQADDITMLVLRYHGSEEEV
jgi:sigma-B regulation protein RsbU (phosphoserine phosphatase)